MTRAPSGDVGALFSQQRADGPAPFAAKLRGLFWFAPCYMRWRTRNRIQSACRVSGGTTGGILYWRTCGAVA